jgi:hypothetical protein
MGRRRWVSLLIISTQGMGFMILKHRLLLALTSSPDRETNERFTRS